MPLNSNVAAGPYTTRFENAHGTVFRELLYHWHPWFGMRVAIHETVDKADGVVFRCTLSVGTPAALRLCNPIAEHRQGRWPGAKDRGRASLLYPAFRRKGR